MPDLDLEKRRLLNKEETLVCIMPRRKRPSDNTDSEDEFDDAKHPQRNAANARERARMRVLSKAFCRLKTTLPWVPADTKLSKLDTLRLATSYIAHLRAILMDQPISNEHTHKHPLALMLYQNIKSQIHPGWIFRKTTLSTGIRMYHISTDL
ncbi:transcription factor 21 isoform X3 [Agrilus planipennis]|uniref:Transcription factor 21 isoform X3 n=1 Tax=Agrilus planipennis TaxID=224129 RepID=A0A1W4XPW7_AGRPL|nr:transcription factor 21 isoform X3 [Agrilus planipennis]